MTASLLSGNAPAQWSTTSVSVSCTGGKVLVGGGATVTDNQASHSALVASFPFATGANGTWRATAMELVDATGSNSNKYTVNVWAACG